MTFVFFSEIFSVSIFIVLHIIIVLICAFFFIIMADATLEFIKKINILFTMTGLLIGMHVYVNCVGRLLRFFSRDISKVLLFLLLLDFFF